MKGADIEVGGEYAYARYSVSKIRVIEKGVKTQRWSNARADGVRFEVVDGTPRKNSVAPTRDIEPWTEWHDERLAQERAQEAFVARIDRIADRLDMPLLTYHSTDRVCIPAEHFYELCRRLGVDTD